MIKFLKKNLQEIAKTIEKLEEQILTFNDPTLSKDPEFIANHIRYLKGVKDAYDFILFYKKTPTVPSLTAY